MEVDILLPAPVRSILSTLQQQGHSAFAVGGCVRDSLMGRAPRLGRVHLRPPRGDQSGVSREMSFGAGHTPRHRNSAAGAHAL